MMLEWLTSVARIVPGRSFATAVLIAVILGWPIAHSTTAAAATPTGQSATLLPDGRWLLLGGERDNRATASAMIVDPRIDSTLILRSELHVARTGHSATVIPGGSVLIVGGTDANSVLVSNVERFDPATQTFHLVLTNLSPRAEHTATMLTDGRLLLVGGLDARGQVRSDVELLNILTGAIERFDAALETARFGHLAALLPSAPVIVWGGLDQHNQPLSSAELFHPWMHRFAPLDRTNAGYLPDPQLNASTPTITGAHPDPAALVPIDATFSVRFSKPIDATTISADTVSLVGPDGHIPLTVAAAEGGLLAFITPRRDLHPTARYTLFVSGARDFAGRELPLAILSYRTGSAELLIRQGAPASGTVSSTELDAQQSGSAAALTGQTSRPSTQALGPSTTDLVNPPIQIPVNEGTLSVPGFTLPPEVDLSCGSDANEEWRPDFATVAKEGWLSSRGPARIPRHVVRTGYPGATSIAGQVFRMNGLPLANVSVRAGRHETVTDSLGLFLLTGLHPGSHVLSVDGTGGGCPGTEYGQFELKVTAKPGETFVLNDPVWMPKLDSSQMRTIASPTVGEVVITNPSTPGLELRIPPGTIVRDRSGKIVTRVGLTPIPIDRAPFALPALFDFRVYYTIQPAGATLEGADGRPRQAQVVYPNYGNRPPGEKFLFWSYDPNEREWHVYGEGKVSADGRSVVPDSSVGIYSFAGFMAAPPNPPVPCDSGCQCTAGGAGGAGGGGSSGGAGGGGGAEPLPFQPFAGDPVTCGLGKFVHAHTDLQVPDVRSLALNRFYVSGDTAVREFGTGISLGLDYNLFVPVSGSYAELRLVLPSGGRVILTCTSGCSSATTAQFEAQSDPGHFYKATMSLNVDRWELRTKDGSLYTFWNYGGRIMSIRDRYGNLTVYTRVPVNSGNLTRVTTSNGRWLEFTYSGNLITAAKDTGGRTWTYQYDASNRMISATNPMSGVWQYTYDASGRMATVRDPRNNLMVTNSYDANGRVSLQTYADSTTTSFAYVVDGQGRVTQTDVTDRRGNLRRLAFDPVGFVTSDTFALGKPEAQTWTAVRQAGSNLITRTTDPLGRNTDHTYDANGNLLTVTRLAGTGNAVTTTYTYGTPFHLVTSVSDPLGHATAMSYDAVGNLTRITDANNNNTDLTYGTDGLIQTVKNALNDTTTYGYEAGLVTTITDPLNRPTTVYNDVVGRPVRITDALGNATVRTLDALDRLTQVSDPLTGTVRYEYDANGNLTAHVDQKNNRTEYTYDAMNRLVSRKDALLRTEGYLYDAASKLSSLTDRQSQVSGFTYDALNRHTQAGFGATVGNPTAYTSTIGYSYDAGNRLLQANDSQNGVITRTYDGQDRLVSETTPTTTVSYTYDAAGRRLTRTVPGQSTMSYVWDNANRLMSLSQGTQTVAFTYDNANRRTKITLPNGVDINYVYDNASQFTSITYKNGATTLGDLIYTYDAAGRRTKIAGSYARSDLPSAIATTTHNANNQLTNWGGPPLSYDLNGNLTGDGTYTYIWNTRNQLTQVKQGATTIASYQYDAFGRRKEKVVNGVTTRFVYDGQNFVQERDGSNAVTANLLTGLGFDELYARTKGAVTSSYLMDHLGTIIAEADAAGTVQTSYSYEAYGKTTQTGAASDNSQRYTGREQDLADLYYYRARYYSPRFERFVREDPIGIAGGMNLYGYAGHDPISRRDPSGLSPCCPDYWCDVTVISTPAHVFVMIIRREYMCGRKNITVTYGEWPQDRRGFYFFGVLSCTEFDALPKSGPDDFPPGWPGPVPPPRWPVA